MEDLHQYRERLETASRKIQNSSQICEENKKLAEQFKDWNALRSTSISRQYRYLSSLKQILGHNDFRLDNQEEDEESKRKIHKILGQIENSEYYSKDYSAKTSLRGTPTTRVRCILRKNKSIILHQESCSHD